MRYATAIPAGIAVALALYTDAQYGAGLFVLAGMLAGAAIVITLTHTASSPTLPTTHRRRPVARRKSSEYRSEAIAEPFELELDARHEDGTAIVVVFADPNTLECETAFDLAMEENPRKSLQTMLRTEREGEPDYWPDFWAEWRSRRMGDLNALLGDVMAHYGADRGKLERSSR